MLGSLFIWPFALLTYGDEIYLCTSPRQTREGKVGHGGIVMSCTYTQQNLIMQHSATESQKTGALSLSSRHTRAILTLTNQNAVQSTKTLTHMLDMMQFLLYTTTHLSRYQVFASELLPPRPRPSKHGQKKVRSTIHHNDMLRYVPGSPFPVILRVVVATRKKRTNLNVNPSKIKTKPIQERTTEGTPKRHKMTRHTTHDTQHTCTWFPLPRRPR